MNRMHHFLSQSLLRTVLIVLCLIAACMLGNRLYARKDMTAESYHTLQPHSIETLGLLTDPLDVEVFINPQDPQTEAIKELFAQYQDHKADIKLTFSDPALDPQRMRELDVAAGGEIFIRYQDRTQRLTELAEQSLTTAMLRLSRSHDRKLIFTTGHGERSVQGKTNADLGLLAAQLRDAGIDVSTTNLSKTTSIDPDSGTLVIAGPMHRFLPTEALVVLDFLSNGGNLVWLTDPASNDGLKSVALELGVTRLPGVVIDLAAQQLQVERPDFAIASDYSPHQALNGFSSVTLFPQSAALAIQPQREWIATEMVQSGPQAWTETGSLSGKVEFGDDDTEVQGPFPLVLGLERTRQGRQQRVVVAGDGDFLADAWIANGGNRELGNRLFNWSVDDTVVSSTIPLSEAAEMNLSRVQLFTLAGVAFLLLPGIMFSTATGVWYRRQHG